MLERNQDILTQINEPHVATCVTTNAVVKQDGKAVMGAGVAKVIRDMYSGSDTILGALIKTYGHKVQQFWITPALVSFPTKDHFKNKSNISLIQRSAKELYEWANLNTQYLTIILPRPGCNNGGLNWEDIKPTLESILVDNRFVVIDKG